MARDIHKAKAEGCLWFSWFIVLFHCFIVWCVCLDPRTYVILLWHDIACVCWKCR